MGIFAAIGTAKNLIIASIIGILLLGVFTYRERLIASQGMQASIAAKLDVANNNIKDISSTNQLLKLASDQCNEAVAKAAIEGQHMNAKIMAAQDKAHEEDVVAEQRIQDTLGTRFTAAPNSLGLCDAVNAFAIEQAQNWDKK